MKRRSDVSCVGELLVDFVSTKAGATLSGSPGFLKRAGGGAANVAAGLARLGLRTSFYGKVGNDPFGRFLTSELAKRGVATSGIRADELRRTRLAFVTRARSGERAFAFWEEHPADEHLSPEDVDLARISRSRLVHIGSLSLLREPGRSTLAEVARRARVSGALVSFDPNIRPALWRTENEARQTLLRMVRLSSILRLNEEEARFLTGLRSVATAARRLLDLGPLLVVTTLGRRGCHALNARGSVVVSGASVRAVDTTGCGDGFLAALLFGLLRSDAAIGELGPETLRSICAFANAAGALTATRFGAIDALPTLARIERFLASRTRSKSSARNSTRTSGRMRS